MAAAKTKAKAPKRAKLRTPKVKAPKVRTPKVTVPKLPAPKKIKAPQLKKIRGGKQNGADLEADAELRELLVAHERLLERFTIMQADLGGAFYEMAIRDHVKLDVLTRKAAELQRVDVELQDIAAKLEALASGRPVECPNCGEEAGPGAAFCASCGHQLKEPGTKNGNGPSA